MQSIAFVAKASKTPRRTVVPTPLFELVCADHTDSANLVPASALFAANAANSAAGRSDRGKPQAKQGSIVTALFPQTLYQAAAGLTSAAPLLTDLTSIPSPPSAQLQELKRLQHILQALPTGVVVLDSKGYVQHANPVAIEMLGEPLIWQRWLDVITRSFRPRSDDGLEVSLHDGRRVQLAISALEDGAGQLIVLTDLTETRQLQSRIAHLQRLSSLGKMMASLAHQIRTPLSSAMLYAQNLCSQKIAPTARLQFQQKLLNRLQDLEQQVNDLLLFARSGREQQVAPLSLQQLLNEVHNSVETLVQQEQGNIELQLPEPDLLILGNHTALSGAMANLIQNALQHAGPGARIQLSALPGPDGKQVLLAVEDSGPGVPRALQQQIFEPFFTTRPSGTGLGLAVVQAVAHSHHGSVRCVDGKAGGARFEMILPVLPATAAVQSGQQEEL
ncbi:MAG TPA: PAS domain-containing sensor histidine kinase [Rheinheimera sp.]|uniref:sensor histidine kinase n=1 Tax=Rheinheimera sp. TaxID=1869214 RepID=UPI000EB93395|nr:ATP-binding protein [Rheinheimera sp.]HCU66618.1 PAS domain-containing sensor histidine kinase [Rheinheimera sp.]